MKNLANAILRILVKIALHGYFRKIMVLGKENIPKGYPIILVANHQNALIDPLLLATHTRLNPWFLTRASVFKNPWVAKILNFIRMLPVFRVRDGFSTIQQNQQIFDKTYDILAQNGTVIIFAEGSHSLRRNLRPLSKGFTRMAFGLMEKYPGKIPMVLPVGIDFSAHKRSGSQVKITFGEPILVDMPASKSGILTKTLESRLKNLIVNIPDEGYDEKLESLIENQIDLTSKTSVESFLSSGQILETYIDPSGLKNKVMKIFHFPLYFIWLWISPRIEDRVFDSTFKFLIGFFLAPLWYLFIVLLALNSSFGSWALTWLIMAWISVLWNKNPQE
ncbi:1-acyl-sn-glycerol-3-phosphate acyltransferase [Algoriphagus boseongensis]|uniref:1-acyl-sn-glycerol-3-phosphate acyltransferase n=1 Tax=Algoriphagus boseongensis TaxID=1442587 RepID=A0A4R6T8U2_9BACT|nr:1-acyl-sn-glycerol-3-phosphate acyltransferase [Algoriphagus boseongensis]TDQ19146.1 1-acyl-sn-glycerol-3-phosphate acyltransferase [Algoriphagus boseongensis]